MTPTASVPAGLRRQVPLSSMTSLKVGGPADLFGTAHGAAEARDLLRWALAEGLPCRWVGGGSNLLVADGGAEGLVARYVADRVELPTGSSGEVVAEAGRSFPNLARALARAGWGGLEWAANVPGTVGGAVANNAGAFGSSVAETLRWAELLLPTGETERLPAAELGYAYRTSRLKRGELGPAVVLTAAFAVRPAPPSEATALVKRLQAQRTATQPRQLSAGSVFANPPGDYAGRLIEAAGMKGRRWGQAEISRRHANFIVNLGGAAAADVYALIRLAQVSVWERFGVWLPPEIEPFGRWSAAQRTALVQPA